MYMVLFALMKIIFNVLPVKITGKIFKTIFREIWKEGMDAAVSSGNGGVFINNILKTLVDKMSEAVLNEFGAEYKFVTNIGQSGSEEGSFYIHSYESTREMLFARQYKSKNSFTIYYYPKSMEAYTEEFGSTCERLYDCLEYIRENDNVIRGMNMRSEVYEGVLHFFVDYYLNLQKETVEEASFDELVVQEGVKKSGS